MESFNMELDYELLIDEEFDALHVHSRHQMLVRDKDILSQKYPAKAHARKVASELGVKDGLIYIPGQETLKLEDSDQPRLFRQRRYFYYMTGADIADCSVTYEIASDRLILWIPFVEPRQILWFGKSPSAAVAKNTYDVDDARYNSQFTSFLAKHLHKDTTLYVLHDDQKPPSIMARAAEGGGGGGVDTTSLQPAVDRARVIKDEYEIALVRRANDISSAAHRRVAENLLQMKNERHLEAVFLGFCDAKNATQQSYPIIAGSGINGSTLHYGENNQPLKQNDVIVFDAGAEYECYASDITRTLPVSGFFPPRAAAILNIVKQMQDECIAGVKPGVLFYSLHVHAGKVAAAGLRKLGILKGAAEEIEAAGTAAAFFPHGLGHHVGLEVHDVPGSLPLSASGLGLEFGKREFVTSEMLVNMNSSTNLVSMRERALLRPGMIVTVEPGIYFCREYLEGYYRDDPRHTHLIDWDVLEKYYSVGGVRLEDDILVTARGNENLSTAPKGAELLSIINAGKRSA